MKVLLDTTTLIAALDGDHDEHERAVKWLERAVRKEMEVAISTHSLAEVYSYLTRILKLSPALALQAIETNLPILELVPLDSADYIALLQRMAGLNITGGTVYDGIIAYAAQKANVDNLVTLNKKHFDRVYPEFADKIIEP